MSRGVDRINTMLHAEQNLPREQCIEKMHVASLSDQRDLPFGSGGWDENLPAETLFASRAQTIVMIYLRVLACAGEARSKGVNNCEAAFASLASPPRLQSGGSGASIVPILAEVLSAVLLAAFLSRRPIF